MTSGNGSRPDPVDAKTAKRKKKTIGRVTQIIGPVVDMTFPPGELPNIYNACVIQGTNQAGMDVYVTCDLFLLTRF